MLSHPERGVAPISREVAKGLHLDLRVACPEEHLIQPFYERIARAIQFKSKLHQLLRKPVGARKPRAADRMCVAQGLDESQFMDREGANTGPCPIFPVCEDLSSALAGHLTGGDHLVRAKEDRGTPWFSSPLAGQAEIHAHRKPELLAGLDQGLSQGEPATVSQSPDVCRRVQGPESVLRKGRTERNPVDPEFRLPDFVEDMEIADRQYLGRFPDLAALLSHPNCPLLGLAQELHLQGLPHAKNRFRAHQQKSFGHFRGNRDDGLGLGPPFRAHPGQPVTPAILSPQKVHDQIGLSMVLPRRPPHPFPDLRMGQPGMCSADLGDETCKADEGSDFL